jgi:hypothetical protein
VRYADAGDAELSLEYTIIDILKTVIDNPTTVIGRFTTAISVFAVVRVASTSTMRKCAAARAQRVDNAVDTRLRQIRRQWKEQ